MGDCIFCTGKLERYLIKKFEHFTIYLNPEQYYLGRVYITLNRHGPESVNELTKQEWDELKEIIEKVCKTLKSLYKYDIINYLILQNRDRNHFHMHLIPRYQDVRIIDGGEEFKDELWGKPPFPIPKKEVNNKLLIKIKEEIQNNL